MSSSNKPGSVQPFDSATFIRNLVDNGGFAEDTSADDTKPAKGSGTKKAAAGGTKGVGAAGAGAADVTAGAKLSTLSVDAADTTGAGTSSTKAVDGGSLDTGANAEAAGAAQETDAATETSALVTDANRASELQDIDSTPMVLDDDPEVAKAQQQLAKDMNDPNVTDEVLQQDVDNLTKVMKDAGRDDDVLTVLTGAMPLNTSQSNMASVYAMAAKNGVDLDSAAGKASSAKSDAKVNKATRDQQKAAQKAAEQAASNSAANYSAAAQRTGSTWSGSALSDMGSTSNGDTSSTGGSSLSYSGPASNFPSDPSQWISFDDMWAKYEPQINQVNTTQETAWLKESIATVAKESGVDERVILAMVMQESSGKVSVHSTNNGVNNPGLMQSHNGVSYDGTQASVLQMIRDGVEGTAYGDGLVQCIEKTGNVFSAFRMYNSGQVNVSNLSDAQGATASYCSDMANRLMGRM